MAVWVRLICRMTHKFDWRRLSRCCCCCSVNWQWQWQWHRYRLQLSSGKLLSQWTRVASGKWEVASWQVGNGKWQAGSGASELLSCIRRSIGRSANTCTHTHTHIKWNIQRHTHTLTQMVDHVSFVESGQAMASVFSVLRCCFFTFAAL